MNQKKTTPKKRPTPKKFKPQSNRKKIIVGILLVGLVGVGLLASTFAAPPSGKGGGKGPKGGGTNTSTSTVNTEADLRALHASLCPKVVNYTNCDTMRVDVVSTTAGWAGSSHPAAGYVEYNSTYLGLPTSSWSDVIAHEVGGHMDTWNELVSKVGVNQSWTDYYDIDKFAKPFFDNKLGKDIATDRAKELYLDCQGAVRNGHIGNYLYSYYGKTSLTSQQSVCSGYRTIFDQAISS